ALLFEARLTARAGDRPREGARQAARARCADRRLERESLGRYTRVTLEARERDRFTLEIGRIDTQGQAIADRQLGVLAEACAAPAPTTVTSTSGTCCVAAATNAASGPFASTAPRPTSSSPSMRTGISPGTVSICPRSTTCVGPPPISPTALPASSTLARKPRPAI